jgi:hypothetical protein
MTLIACVQVNGSNDALGALWRIASGAAPQGDAQRVVVGVREIDSARSCATIYGVDLDHLDPQVDELVFELVKVVPNAGVDDFVRGVLDGAVTAPEAPSAVVVPGEPPEPTGPKVKHAVFEYAAAKRGARKPTTTS